MRGEKKSMGRNSTVKALLKIKKRGVNYDFYEYYFKVYISGIV